MQRRTFCTCSFSALLAPLRTRAEKSAGAEALFCSSMYPPASEGVPVENADLSSYKETDFAHLVTTAASMLPSGVEMNVSFADRLESAAFDSWSDTIVFGLENASGNDSLRMAVLVILHEISHSLQIARAKSRDKLLNYRSKGSIETRIIESHADKLSGYLLFILLKRAYPDSPKDFDVSDGFIQNGFVRNFVGDIEFCSGDLCDTDSKSRSSVRLFPPLPRSLGGDREFDQFFIAYRFIGGKIEQGATHPSRSQRMAFLKEGFVSAFYGVGGSDYFRSSAEALEAWEAFE